VSTRHRAPRRPRRPARPDAARRRRHERKRPRSLPKREGAGGADSEMLSAWRDAPCGSRGHRSHPA
jgi:hypothetical protein